MEYDCGFQKENNWFRYRAAAIIVEDGCVLFVSNEIDNYFYSVGGGVHMNEKAEDADNETIKGYRCHEVAFYYLMKSRGRKELHSDSYTCGVRENMHWIPIEELDHYKAFPTFMKDYLKSIPDGIVHIVTDEREK